jgi:hypothetical protein
MKQVTITFSQLNTERDYDFVNVIQCHTMSCLSGELLYQLSGSYSSTQSFTATTGFVIVWFSSDESNVFGGFSASWTSTSVSNPCT